MALIACSSTGDCHKGGAARVWLSVHVQPLKPCFTCSLGTLRHVHRMAMRNTPHEVVSLRCYAAQHAPCSPNVTYLACAGGLCKGRRVSRSARDLDVMTA